MNDYDPQAGIRQELKRIRRTLGLSQDDAAQLAHITRLTYHRLESGHQRISLDHLASICSGFGCHIGDLVQDPVIEGVYRAAARSLLGRPIPV